MARKEIEKEQGPFRFAASPDPETDRFYIGLLRRITERICEEVPGPERLALVLSGSLAMGEGCAQKTDEGGLRPGSDIDLYIVTEEGNLGELGGRMDGIRKRLLSALGIPGLVIDLGATSPERLAGLPPSMANCLLVRFGKTLAGDPDLLGRARRPRYEEIPPRDGFLLLLNRTVEELMEIRVPPRGQAEDRDFWYRFGKTVRDLGTSALVAGGGFVPRLSERREALPGFLKSERIAEGSDRFAEDHRFWCLQKEDPDPEAARARYGGGEEAYREANARKTEYVGMIWEWETARIFGARSGRSATGRLEGADRFRRRAREWLRFTLRGGAVGALRHLGSGFAITPLLANYTAAVLLVRSWGPLFGAEPTAGDGEALDEAYRIAPSRPAPDGDYRERWVRLRLAVCEMWNREVMGGTRPPERLE